MICRILPGREEGNPSPPKSAHAPTRRGSRHHAEASWLLCWARRRSCGSGPRRPDALRPSRRRDAGRCCDDPTNDCARCRGERSCIRDERPARRSDGAAKRPRARGAETGGVDRHIVADGVGVRSRQEERARRRRRPPAVRRPPFATRARAPVGRVGGAAAWSRPRSCACPASHLRSRARRRRLGAIAKISGAHSSGAVPFAPGCPFLPAEAGVGAHGLPRRSGLAGPCSYIRMQKRTTPRSAPSAAGHVARRRARRVHARGVARARAHLAEHRATLRVAHLDLRRRGRPPWRRPGAPIWRAPRARQHRATRRAARCG